MDYRTFGTAFDIKRLFDEKKLTGYRVEDGPAVLNTKGRWHLAFTGPENLEIWFRNDPRKPSPQFLTLDKAAAIVQGYGFDEFYVKLPRDRTPTMRSGIFSTRPPEGLQTRHRVGRSRKNDKLRE